MKVSKKNKTSKYQGVYFSKSSFNKNAPWVARIFKSVKTNGYNWYSFHVTEREAAIAYDKKMIELGFKPVNILKKK